MSELQSRDIVPSIATRAFFVAYQAGGNAYTMRIVFSDETGMGSRKDEPIVVVSAVVMNLDKLWDPIRKGLGPAWERFVHDKSKSPEMKGRRLLKQARRDPDSSAAHLMRAVTSKLVEHAVPVFYEAVHREGFEMFEEPAVKRMTRVFPDLPADPYSHAIACCIDQVLAYTQHVFAEEKVLWIADRSGRFENPTKASLQWQRLLDLFSRGNRKGAVSQLVDTIYFGDSQESLSIQLADVCCTVIAGHLNGDDAAEPFFETLRRTIIAEKAVQYDIRAT